MTLPESQELPEDPLLEQPETKLKLKERIKESLARFWLIFKAKGVVPKDQFESFSVVLGRDLVFMDWTIQFGGQLLGILVGALVGY